MSDRDPLEEAVQIILDEIPGSTVIDFAAYLAWRETIAAPIRAWNAGTPLSDLSDWGFPT
jgi:hypothetical protein